MNKHNLTCGHKGCYKRNEKECRGPKRKAYGKLYAEKHKEKFKLYKKLYYEKNKEKLYLLRKSPGRKFTQSRQQAKTRGISWSITKKEYIELTSKKCYYCNGELPIFVGGLDRINSNGSYSIDNVVPCCSMCNRIKSDYLTMEETKYIMTCLLEFRTKNAK